MNLSAVDVLIYGNNRNLVTLQKTALAAFNFKKIHWSPTFTDMRESMTLAFRDIIIINDHADLDMEALLTMLRTEKSIANPFAVVILVTPNSSRKYIQNALRIGADGVMGLPFSATDMWKQLSFFINHQRTFLRTGSYFGPDRRRIKGISYDGDERRDADEIDEDDRVADRSRLAAAS